MNLASALNIKNEEKRSVGLLLANSFFVGLLIAYYLSYATGSFLGHEEFRLEELRYAILGAGGLALAISAIYSVLQSRLKFSTLVRYNLISLLALTILFWLGQVLLNKPYWLTFIIYIFIAAYFMLTVLQFWGIVIKIFDVRQGKRLFGLLGAGEVVSSILGFFSVPLLVKGMNIAAEWLLVLGATGLLVGIILQEVIIREFGGNLDQNTGKKSGKKQGFKIVFSKRYFSLIFFMTILSLIVYNFVDYTFMGLAKVKYPDKTILTSFIGVFFGILKVIEFVLKSFVARIVLDRYGIKVSLLLLPVILVPFMIAGTSFSGNLTLFFLMFCVIKLFDMSVRRSIDQPASKLLFSPLDREIRLTIQTYADGQAKQLGKALAGIMLILLGMIPGFDFLHSSFLLILLTLGWLYLCILTIRDYRKTVEEKLNVAQSGTEQPPLTDQEWIEQSLISENCPDRPLALTLLEGFQPGAAQPFFSKIVTRHGHQTDEKILGLIAEGRLLAQTNCLKKLHESGASGEIRQRAETLLREFDAIMALKPDLIRNLAYSPETADRVKAAAWLSSGNKQEFQPLIGKLLKDQEFEVVQTLLLGISRAEDPRHFELLLGMLSEPHLSACAFGLLSRSGNKIIPSVEAAFQRHYENPPIQMRLVQLMGFMEGEDAVKFLKRHFNTPDILVQDQALLELIRKNVTFTGEEQEEVRKKTTREADFAIWLIAAISDLKDLPEMEEITRLLQKELEITQTRIFHQLALMFDQSKIEIIHQSLFSGEKERESLGIELADILLSKNMTGQAIKEWIIPLIDQIPFADKLKRLQEDFPQRKMSPQERLENILFHDFLRLNPWIKALALEKLGAEPEKFKTEILANTHSSSNLRKQVSNQLLSQREENLTAVLLAPAPLPYGENAAWEQPVSLPEKIRHLQSVPPLMEFGCWTLERLGEKVKKLHLESGIPRQPLPRDSVFFLTGGALKISLPAGEVEFTACCMIGLEQDFPPHGEIILGENSTTLFHLSKVEFWEILRVAPNPGRILYQHFLKPEMIETTVLNPESILLSQD
ncbi:MAG: hypothetical protein H6581_05295 [Bacteroidia bacterium]|nr:hypothetical protein [Bacteroidia bacterium]